MKMLPKGGESKEQPHGHTAYEGQVLQHAQVDDRLLDPQLPQHQGDQRYRCDSRHVDDEGGFEPVISLAALQEQLHGCQGDNQQDNANHVDARQGALGIRRLGQEGQHHEHADDADGNVDIEDPWPAVGIGQPSAQHWAHGGRQNHTHHEYRHGRAAFSRQDKSPA